MKRLQQLLLCWTILLHCYYVKVGSFPLSSPAMLMNRNIFVSNMGRNFAIRLHMATIDKRQQQGDDGNSEIYTLPAPPESGSRVADVSDQDLGFSVLENQMDNVEIVNDFRPIKKTNQKTELFVDMFRGSANYIAHHRGGTIVLHIPATLIDLHCSQGKSDLENILDDVALLWLLGIKLVVIMGCRELVDRRLVEDGKSAETKMHKGIRVTDETMLKYLKEEAGYARFEVERQLARALRRKAGNENASIGGNVVSGNFFSAMPVGVRDGIDFQYTGLLRRVEVAKIQQAHQSHDVVVLTSLGVSPSGELFSVKSESLAAGVASSLKADKIMYLLQDPCYLRDSNTKNTLMSLRLAEAKRLMTNFGVFVNDSTGEYISSNFSCHSPGNAFLERIGFCSNALTNGVKRAHLICPSDGSILEELFTVDDGSGTMISRDLYDGIRRAKVEDVIGIRALIQPLVDSGTIVDRPISVLEKEVQTFYVYTRDENVIACGQLKRYEGGFAEIGCLAVSTTYRKSGKGDAMLSYLERIGIKSGATSLFVLSTQTMQWFMERGFKEVGIDDLPMSKKAVYNHERKSKIYIKNINDMRDIDAEELLWDK